MRYLIINLVAMLTVFTITTLGVSVSLAATASCYYYPSKCNNNELCSRATFGSDIIKFKSFANGHVKEAKTRGLTCNVGSVSSSSTYSNNSNNVDYILKTEFSYFSLESRKQIQRYLKTKRHYFGSIDGYWGSKTKLALKKELLNTSLMSNKSWVKKALNRMASFTNASAATASCYYYPSKCNNNELCSRATFGSDIIKFKSFANGHVKEAKTRGLTCNVGSVSSSSSSSSASNTIQKPKTCNEDPTLCTVAQLCSRASHYSGGKKAWRKDYSSKKYVTEAENNGVTCGVKIITAKVYNCNDGPSYCTASQLCSKASHYSGGKKVWKKDYSSKKYVTEAKSLGVSCGVKIEVAQPKKEELLPAASGSGFFVSNEGHIVTNEHVIEGCEIVKVHQRGEIVESKVLTFDRFNDLALIKINENPEVVFSLTDQPPYLDQDIRAAGYPLVSDLGTNLKVTRGVVSALSAVNDITRFQMDVAVQPGNSGGPIFDNEGNILGVVVSRLINETAQNVNFGIKAATVRSLLNSNGVNLLPPNKSPIDKRKFSEFMRKGTVLLSCWMTLTQIEKAQEKNTGKVLFKEFQK